MRWSKRCGVKDQLELSGDVMKYVIIEVRLLESLRMTWQDTKMPKLEYYIANINPQDWFQCKEKIIEHIQWHVTTPISLGSRRES